MNIPMSSLDRYLVLSLLFELKALSNKSTAIELTVFSLLFEGLKT
jgi:hypothetical protein